MNDNTKALLKATMIDPLTYELLKANGASDRQSNISMHDGWAEIAKACGYPEHMRTPAREAYEDGYYGA